MTTEVLLLALACGMTLLAYMIAINAHGSTRLSLSYLIATIMLAGTVWGIVQYVNTDLDSKKIEELRRLEREKQRAEERVQTQEELLRSNKDRMTKITRINTIIATGSGYSSNLINIELQDKNVDFDVLLSRASEIRKKTDELKSNFESVSVADTFFNEITLLLKEGIQYLSEASLYYRLYYLSEDSTQEQLRERVLRQKARAAFDIFQKAGAKISSGN